MMNLEEAKRILGAFAREGVECVMIGSVAMAALGPGMLYRMKKGTVRPQDRLDAETLRREFGLDEAD